MSKFKKCCMVSALVFVLLGVSIPQALSAEKNSMTIVGPVEAVTLDVIRSTNTSNALVMSQIFEPLLAWNEAITDVIPSVALSVTLSKDPKMWVAKIRPGIKAHNGEVIDAEDVAWSINDTINPDSNAFGMKWVQGNSKIEKAVVIDPLTVHIYTTTPNPVLRQFLPRWYVRPKDYYSTLPIEEHSIKPVGSGPYKLTEFFKGSRIVLDEYKGWWGGEVDVKQLVWRPVPEESARVAELNTGGADVITHISPDQHSRIDTKVANMHAIQGARKIYIQFNFTEHKETALIQDKRVRQALNYGMDFQKILDNLLGPGVGQKQGTFIVAPYSHPDIKAFPYDPKKALALMKEAGYYDRNGDGFVDLSDGKRFELTLQYSRNTFLKDSEIVQALCAEWQKTGIFVQPEPVEKSVLRAATRKRGLQSAMTFRGSGFSQTGQGDVSQFCSFSTNYGYWVNEDFDKNWTALSLSFDDKERKEYSYNLEKIMQEECPIVFLYMQVDYYGISNRVDIKPTPIEYIWYHRAKWAK